jgi:hypothetical protein
MFAIATINASNGINTTGVIENTFGLFEISFGVLHFSAGVEKVCLGAGTCHKPFRGEK